ncbi:dTDP-4-dehydrorhamnose reductase [Amaricoccus macauensis]|uniref:dTDP-4-dehydrorhamnose reductase n=1 Tax=Amaricoccus macauensis TaxID=57001 RepID=A0A840SKZ7_9RHOB|nr:dTDP-4-dehydrorhamnose reductase [Amaricoccus macauensis]MBB5223789.1 dTDP-4-dehydrorhamnose reductase [Amaricoccus macauensis]
MRALIFGSTGQVARELRRAATGLGIEATFLDRAAADLADPAACAAAVRAASADVVVNAAAYTAVDRAEDEPDLATRINGETPGAIAAACDAKGVPFLHVSTDYVFDGTSGRAWREDDPTGPLGAYGHSKLAGEQAIIAACPDHVILRTAWVFSAHGANFVKTMLKVGKDRPEMRVVGDQEGCPTAAADIAGALWTIAGDWGRGRGRAGIFHYAGAPATSWAGFASAIFERTSWPARPAVTEIATADWPTKAVRPANSVLDCSAIEAAYGIAQPDWRLALDEVLEELGEASA